MAQIKPFKAVLFNQEKIKDLSRVICPPYDVISSGQQQIYHDLDSNNFIRIILGKDAGGENKYRRAANYFRDWQEAKVFIRDEKPAIYFYSHQYNLKGEKKTRLGFIALMKLDSKSSSVFAHEHTRLEPKEDRLRLLREVKANLSPIFVVFSDAKRIIQRIYQQNVLNKKPFIDCLDLDKSVHRLWRIDSEERIAAIKDAMSLENIFIADGHHRYEVACAYRDEMRQKCAHFTGEEDFNYLMAYFTNTDPYGLSILPIHRLIKLSSAPDQDNLLTRLNNNFELEELKDKRRFFFLMEKGGRSEHVLGMYLMKKYWLLRLKNIKILDKMISDKPGVYRLLDVSILNYLILQDIFGMDLENKEGVSFIPSAEEIIEEVDKDNSRVGFLLNSVKINQMMAVALTGNRMPPKSTYFYPKVASGLVINRLE